MPAGRWADTTRIASALSMHRRTDRKPPASVPSEIKLSALSHPLRGRRDSVSLAVAANADSGSRNLPGL